MRLDMIRWAQAATLDSAVHDVSWLKQDEFCLVQNGVVIASQDKVAVTINDLARKQYDRESPLQGWVQLKRSLVEGESAYIILLAIANEVRPSEDGDTEWLFFGYGRSRRSGKG